MKAGEAYLIRGSVAETHLHKTGPCVQLHTEVKRLVLIFHGRFSGDPTSSEHDLLRKDNFLSRGYHYAYEAKELHERPPRQQD